MSAQVQLFPSSTAQLSALLLNALQLHHSGERQKARVEYRRILAAHPQHAETLHLLGVLEGETGEGASGEEKIRKAIAIQPLAPSYHGNLGNLLCNYGKPVEAEAAYREAMRLDPLYTEAPYNLGNLLLALCRYEEAAEAYQTAIALAPLTGADAYNNLGVVLGHLERNEEAMAEYLKAIELKPDFAGAYFNMGKEAAKLGNEKAAFDLLKRAIELDPNHAGSWHMFGAVLETCGLFQQAIFPYKRSIELDPKNLDVRANLAQVLSTLGFSEGLALLEEQVRLQPDSAEMHWHWGMGLLLHGDFARGWEKYEHRKEVARLRYAYERFAGTEWDGQPLQDEEPLLLYSEQGFGDTLQFVRYVPLVRERCSRIILAVPAGLCSLLGSLPGVANCIPLDSPLPDFAKSAPFMSLPYLLQDQTKDIPLPLYPVSVAKATGLPSRTLRVGLVWAGNPKHTRDRLRSIPLPLLKPLTTVTGVAFTSLQVGTPAEQVATHGEDFHFVQDCAKNTHFSETAAVIAELDLVITIDSAVAHLAGTMGVPVWILLYQAVDWRWGLRSSETPWYPSARLFRQTAPADWVPVVAQVKEALQALVASRSASPQLPLREAEYDAGAQ